MAQVNWIKGTIEPPNEGVYYIIIEALTDEIEGFKKGDMEVTVDSYDKEMGFWTIGKENPFWGIVCWANVLTPDIPQNLRKDIKVYFGEKINE